MKPRLTITLIILLGISLVTGACGSGTAPTPIAGAKPAATSAPAPKAETKADSKTAEAPKPAKEAESKGTGSADAMAKYDALVQGAKAEGKIRVVSSQGLIAEPLKNTFGKKFGIDVEYQNQTPAAMIAQLKTERQAGQHNLDVVLTGATALLLDMIPEKMLASLDDVLVLPEVTDTSKWLDGKLPWADPGHHTLRFNKYVAVYIMINTSIVKPGEIKSYKDLVDPKWKGKIAAEDPNTPGAGQSGALFMLVAFGEDFVKQLYVGQEPVFSTDRKQLGDWVARGRYPVEIWNDQASLTQLQNEGFPVDTVVAADANGVDAGWSIAAMIDQVPHPNAAKLFMNWIASKEGQDMLVKVSGRPVTRLDADLAGVPDSLKLQPGVKYMDIVDYDFVVSKRAEAVKKLNEIIPR